MGDVVNLNRTRKAKAKQAATVQAAANRAAFGRTKAEKQAEADRRLRDAAELDGHQRCEKDALTKI